MKLSSIRHTIPTRANRLLIAALLSALPLAGVAEGKTVKKKQAAAQELPVELICPAVKAGKNADKDSKRRAQLHKRLVEIAKGGDINAADKNGQTALMFASALNDEPAACWLVAKGADVTLKSKSGKTATDYAKSRTLRELYYYCANPPAKSAGEPSAEDQKKVEREFLSDVRFYEVPDYAAAVAQGLDVSIMARAIEEQFYFGDATPLTRLAYMVRCGYDVNTRTPEGKPGIGWGLSKEEMRLLLALGLRTDDEGEDIRLFVAMLSDDIETIKRMLAEKPELKDAKLGYRSALDAARSAEAARILLAAGSTGGYSSKEELFGRIMEYSSLHHPGVLQATLELFDKTPSFDISPLHWMLQDEHAAERVKICLAAGCDPNENKNGRTPLDAAAEYKNPEVIRTLLEAGADLSKSTAVWHLFDTPYSECETDQFQKYHLSRVPETLALLLEKGADVNATDAERNETPIQRAVSTIGRGPNEPLLHRAQMETLRMLLDAGAKVPTDILTRACPVLDYFGQSNIHLLPEQWQELVARLTAKGADPNALDKDGKTVLMGLTPQGAAVVKLLLDAGADAKALDSEGQNALFYASDAETLHLLLQAGADAKVVDKKGRTPLTQARTLAMAEALVKAGTDAKVGDPISAAVQRENHSLELTRFLLQAGAAVPSNILVNLPNRDENETRELFKLLLDHGADPKACNKDGITALMVAAKLSPELAKRLLEAGAAPKAATASGYSVLHQAYYADTVDRLLKAGAEVRKVYKDYAKREWEPLVKIMSEAGEQDIVEITRMMLKAGAKPCGTDANGVEWDLFQFLARFKSPKVRKELIALIKPAGGDINRAWLAVDGNKVPTAELLAAGADPNYRYKNNLSRLEVVLYDGNLEDAALLLKAGADINRDALIARLAYTHSVSKDAPTREKCEKSIRWLLEHGADASAKGFDGKTALELARKMNDEKLIKLLESRGKK